MPTELNTHMTQHTTDRIDAAHRAIHHPDEAAKSDIAAELDGQCLQDVATLQSLEPICHRTREKNEKRRMAGLGREDEHLKDGDRVTLHAVFCDDPELPAHWAITRLDRAEHPHRDFVDWVESGTALVRAEATFHRVDNDPTREHVVDVTVTDHSPTAHGPNRSKMDRERQQYVDDSDEHPDGMTVIDRPPEEPPANWPQPEREWLDGLVDDYGPLERQSYEIDSPPVDGL